MIQRRALSRTKSPKNYARNRAAYLSARNPKERRSKRIGRLGSKKVRQADRQRPHQRQRSKRAMKVWVAHASRVLASASSQSTDPPGRNREECCGEGAATNTRGGMCFP